MLFSCALVEAFTIYDRCNNNPPCYLTATRDAARRVINGDEEDAPRRALLRATRRTFLPERASYRDDCRRHVESDRASRSSCFRIAGDRMRFLRNRSGTESPRSLDSMRNRQVSSPLRRTADVSPRVLSLRSRVSLAIFRIASGSFDTLSEAEGRADGVFLFAGAIPVPGFRRRSEPEDRPRNVSAHVPGHRLPEDDAAETQASSSGGTTPREIPARRSYVSYKCASCCMSFFLFVLIFTPAGAPLWPACERQIFVTLFIHTLRRIFALINTTFLLFILSSSFLILRLKSGENDLTRVRCIDFFFLL